LIHPTKILIEGNFQQNVTGPCPVYRMICPWALRFPIVPATFGHGFRPEPAVPDRFLAFPVQTYFCEEDSMEKGSKILSQRTCHYSFD
jgi:hypothetical protein